MALVRELPVEAFLRSHHIRFEVAHHASSESALAEADAIGIPARYVVKSVLIRGRDGFVIAILPASRMLDMHRLHKAMGYPEARLATEGEIMDEFPGFELGALPPLPELLGLSGYVDPSVLDLEEVACAGGRRTESFIANPRELMWGQDVFVEKISRPLAWHLEGDALGLE